MGQIPADVRQAHQPSRPGKIALSFAARAQSRGLVRVERRGVRQGADGGQAHPFEHWLLDMPLVSRDGARKF